MARKLRVVVAGGGTAGHIEPALATADALKERGAEVIALGTTKGLETTLVPARGYELSLIDPVPVPRKPNVDLLKLPWRLLRSVRQAMAALKAHEADVLIGFGGYVSAPAYLAAKLTRTPFFVHEANARAGMANKLGVALGGKGLLATRAAGLGLKGEVVGIPLRASLSNAASPEELAAQKVRASQLWGLDPQRPTILVTGGSQGAVSINKAVTEAAPDLVKQGFQVLHQVGKKNPLPELSLSGYVPVHYVEDMAAAYAITDLVICRSGAMTVAENSARGKVAIYVPLPIGNGEQALNAAEVVERGGAVLIQDAELSGELLSSTVAEISEPGRFAQMQHAVSSLHSGNAAQTIADLVFETADHPDHPEDPEEQ
ncbi:undecaprenyldiphospho-muramoylpentapeptide beta-N-acetylglucosaminyltransferase [Corynebacterium sp. 35RC1]|nr:undecaprenyldiphospho-muramoylpentapeptide beta-N-acetylglucosaminyltransferase [Corynebacterium sp. 35RC1]